MGSAESIPLWGQERAQEHARLAAAFSRAADGRGAIVVLDGPPGIGKTALVDDAAQLAEEQGLIVARARAHQLESQLPFAVVRALLEPALASLPGDPLTGAAAPAARVLGPAPAEPADAEASAQVLHGLYSLVVRLADERPLAVLLDDAHWSDTASQRALLYLAHRAAPLSLALVVAVRGGEAPALRDGLLAGDGASLVRPSPLGADAVGTLLTERLGRTARPELRDACRHATGGVPLP